MQIKSTYGNGDYLKTPSKKEIGKNIIPIF